MIGLGQEDEIEEITLRLEIWWHDAVYHEADHCMKWPLSSNVRIFWFRPAEGAVVLWTSCFMLYVWQGIPAGIYRNGVVTSFFLLSRNHTDIDSDCWMIVKKTKTVATTTHKNFSKMRILEDFKCVHPLTPSVPAFHNDFSPSGEHPEQHKLAHVITIFHKYCCYTKHGDITTNLSLRNLWGHISDMSKYHRNAGYMVRSMD